MVAVINDHSDHINSKQEILAKRTSATSKRAKHFQVNQAKSNKEIKTVKIAITRTKLKRHKKQFQIIQSNSVATVRS